MSRAGQMQDDPVQVGLVLAGQVLVNQELAARRPHQVLSEPTMFMRTVMVKFIAKQIRVGSSVTAAAGLIISLLLRVHPLPVQLRPEALPI